MVFVAGLLLLLAPSNAETERMLLGDSPFFRHEGMRRAVAAGDRALLQRAAISGKWDVRRLAAMGLGAHTPHGLLKDPIAAVRAAAVEALDVTAPETLLLKLLEDEDDAVRAAAVWALRARTNKTPLRKLWRDPSASVRMTALAAGGGLTKLRKLATDDNLAVAVPSLAALGRAGGAAEAIHLLRALSKALTRHARGKRPVPLYLQETPHADIALARAVGEMARRGLEPGGRSLRTLIAKLVTTSKPSASGRILLAYAVAGSRDLGSARLILDGQVGSIAKSARSSISLQVGLEEVLYAFAQEPWPELAPLLSAHLRNRSPRVRAAVALALTGPAANKPLGDPAPMVRVAACSRVEDALVLAELVRGEENVSVLIAAAHGLGRLGGDDARDGVERLLRHADARVRHAAVGATLRVSMKSRDRVLLNVALGDVSATVRAAAAAVLDFHERNETILPMAIRMLVHEDIARRQNAIALIHRLTDARVGFDPANPKAGAAQWQQWWAAQKKHRKVTGGFRYHVADLRKRGLDIALVLDATGSMAPVIQATKRRLQRLIETLRELVPDLRVRIVVYRDAGDAFLTLASPFTHELRVLEDYLSCIPAAGGGDQPEAVLSGLRRAIVKTPWRAKPKRVVLLFGDAPPHERHMALLEATLREFKGSVHAVDVAGFGMGPRGSSKPNAAFLKIGKWGHGTATTLQNEADLLRELLVLILGPRFRTDIETLFGL